MSNLTDSQKFRSLLHWNCFVCIRKLAIIIFYPSEYNSNATFALAGHFRLNKEFLIFSNKKSCSRVSTAKLKFTSCRFSVSSSTKKCFQFFGFSFSLLWSTTPIACVKSLVELMINSVPFSICSGFPTRRSFEKIYQILCNFEMLWQMFHSVPWQFHISFQLGTLSRSRNYKYKENLQLESFFCDGQNCFV